MLIKAFAFRHSLSKVAINDLLRLITMLLPQPTLLPKSFHRFDKLFPVSSENISVHYYCSNLECSSLVVPPQTRCELCNTDFEESSSRKNGSFFVTMDVCSQIKNILETDGVGDQLFATSSSTDNEVCDVTDGNLYRSIPLLASRTGHISITWNCDGVPLFKNSKQTLWPIRCKINELPEPLASRNLIMAALWFGPKKPCMSTFLRPFVTCMNDINVSGGISWQQSSTQTVVQSKVLAIVCCADAPAKCMLQGTNQFNGEYGCNYCLHKGEVLSKGNGHVRVYPLQDTMKRTHNLLISHGDKNVQSKNKHEMGVKTLTPLVLLNKFDMVKGFTIDYMHCILLGIVRQFLDLWLNTKHHEEPWYIGKRTTEINLRLLAIKPPCNIKRMPRLINHYSNWKASECRSWILFYSLYVMDPFLPRKYLLHWFVLVESIYCLLGNRITVEGLRETHKNLLKFIEQVPALYGVEHVTYNVHLLSHLCDSVCDTGPLWRCSAFAFESHNQQLLSLFHGTTHILSQISDNIIKMSMLNTLLKKSTSNKSSISISVETFVRDMLNGYPMTFHASRLCDSVLLGVPVCRKLKDCERMLLQPVYGNLTEAQFYSRAAVGGQIYCTQMYGAKLKTISYVVLLKRNVVGCIVDILSLTDVSSAVAFLKPYVVQPRSVLKNYGVYSRAKHILVVKDGDTTIAVKCEDIQQKCVMLGNCDRSDFKLVALQPNLCEVD